MLTNDIIDKYDKSNMYKTIFDMHKQLKESISIINNFNPKVYSYNNIIICGMGGSAIGGDFVKNILSNDTKVPIYVNRGYDLPSWVNSNTLVVLCSYSGNTEETISCYNYSKKLTNHRLIISSGGFLLSEAIQNNIPFIELIKGIQPRAAFGYSSTLLLLSLEKLDVTNASYINIVKNSIDSLEKMSRELSEISGTNKAIQIASKIYKKFIIIYGTPITEIVSLRFRGQLAENSKTLSMHNTIPEQNHNEIEGFLKQKNSVIIWIEDEDDIIQNKNRIKFTSKVLTQLDDQIFCKQSGSHQLERMYKNILFFDWVSFYLAILNKVDPTPVNNIMKLKKLLS